MLCFVLFLNFLDVYILNPYEEGYVLRYKNEKTIYVYMLIRYCTLVRYCTHIIFILFKKKSKS